MHLHGPRVAGAWRLRSGLAAAAGVWFGFVPGCVWLVGRLAGLSCVLLGDWVMVARWLGLAWLGLAGCGSAYYLNLT